jgi:hypothetical protein
VIAYHCGPHCIVAPLAGQTRRDVKASNGASAETCSRSQFTGRRVRAAGFPINILVLVVCRHRLQKVHKLFRTFIFGLILGFLGAGAVLYLVPVVDQHRVPSRITVQTNGGNSEVFSIRLPADRIMAGGTGQPTPVPDALIWPDMPALNGFKTELFKVRDIDNTVVGVASRMAKASNAGDGFVQWVVYLPARGTMFVAMEPNRVAGQARDGHLSAGTHEFAELHGSVREAFVRDDKDAEADSEGRIDLHVALVGSQEDTP